MVKIGKRREERYMVWVTCCWILESCVRNKYFCLPVCITKRILRTFRKRNRGFRHQALFAVDKFYPLPLFNKKLKQKNPEADYYFRML